MNRKFIILSVFFLLVFTVRMMADAGPKPSMKFSFVYKTSHPVTAMEGWQLESKFERFNVFDTLRRMGPQGFTIFNGKASSVSYGYEDYHRIVIRYNDRTRVSNVFENESFNSKYEVTVYDDRLEVKDVTPFMKDSSTWAVFLKALMLTLALELLVAFVYLKLSKKPLFILLFVILGNLITLPVLWFFFPHFMNVGAAIILGELFAFFTEGLFLLVTCRKWFKPSGAFLLSFMMNLMSLLVGGFALILMVAF